MRITSQTSSDGVTEQLFTLPFTFGEIPGVLWTPDGAAGTRPLILMGHGGGQHKKAPGIVARARRFAAECGFAVAAIDAPGHGGRPQSEELGRIIAEMRTRAQTGKEVGTAVAGIHALLAGQAVPEWRAVLGLNRAETSAEAAAQISVPVEFLLQWDDEMVPRAASLALFDAFGSAEKTLHANSGKHAEIPAFELDSALRFFTRHLC
jgi:predicted alpha/beta hydrolase